MSLTDALSSNLNYDYTSNNYTNTNTSDRYIYRVQQINSMVLNESVPQLTFILWSGEYFVFIRTVKNEIIIVLFRCLYAMPNHWRKF